MSRPQQKREPLGGINRVLECTRFRRPNTHRLVAGIAQETLRHPTFLRTLEALEPRVPIRDAFWPEAFALTFAAARLALSSLPPQVGDLDATLNDATSLFLDATLYPETPPEVKRQALASLRARAQQYGAALRSTEPTVAVWHLFREGTGAEDLLDTAEFGSLVVPLVESLKAAYAQVRVV